jgi:ribosomal protein S18 acetylase RimI-like enzyme
MNCSLTEASESCDFLAIARLAEEVWHNTYDSIIGPEQVDYMLKKFQNADVIENDIKQHGYRYLIAKNEDGILGYCGIKPEDNKQIFLSKVYINPKFQRKGIAKAMIQYLKNEYQPLGYTQMHLTVNKNNRNAIVTYEKLGFLKSGELVTDIGEGFVMDDDTMVLKFED